MDNNISQYSDIDLTFTPHPVKKDVSKNTGEMAVVKALKNLILYNFYEKPFKPNFGSNLRALLFEPLSPVTSAVMRNEILTVINNYEPRVDVISVTINPLYDYNSYQAIITFKIINLPNPFTVDFILSRIR